MYTFGHRIHEDPFHVTIVRTQLTKHLSPVFGDMHDEIATAFGELVPEHGKGQSPRSFYVNMFPTLYGNEQNGFLCTPSKLPETWLLVQVAVSSLGFLCVSISYFFSWPQTVINPQRDRPQSRLSQPECQLYRRRNEDQELPFFIPSYTEAHHGEDHDQDHDKH